MNRCTQCGKRDIGEFMTVCEECEDAIIDKYVAPEWDNAMDRPLRKPKEND